MRRRGRARLSAPTIIDRAITVKEQLLQEAPGWSEHDAEVALRAVQREHGSDTDEWGDISKGYLVERITRSRRKSWRRSARHFGAATLCS